MRMQLRQALGCGGLAETWVNNYHLQVIVASDHPMQLLVSPLHGKLPSGMASTFDGTLRLEMELEQHLDYHRNSAIWATCGEVAFDEAHQRRLIHEALRRGLEGRCLDEKHLALAEIARLLGLDGGVIGANVVRQERESEMADCR